MENLREVWAASILTDHFWAATCVIANKFPIQKPHHFFCE